MKLHKIVLLIVTLTCFSTASSAKNNQDIEKGQQNSYYGFINYLNQVLRTELGMQPKPGIKQVSTIQKNRQIIVQVIHDPLLSYSALIEDIAQSASRVNGVNFQNSFTLDILGSYCKTDLFYIIQGEGLESEVMIQYEDLSGNNVALHTINKNLCQP